MKSPFERMSSRTIRVVYSAYAAIVLAVCALNFLVLMFWKVVSNDQCEWKPIPDRMGALLITNIVPGGVADRAGLKDGDVLLAIDGERFDFQSAMALINRHESGHFAVYRIERGGRTFDVRIRIVKTFNTPYFAQFVLGLGFLLVGFFVVMTKPQGKLQRRFARYCYWSMVFFGLAVVNVESADPQWRYIILGTSFLITRVFAPPAFITFFLHFPVRKRAAERKGLIVALYTISSLSVAVFALNLLRIPVDQGLRFAMYYVGYAMLLTGFGVFIHSYFTRVETERRRQLRPILNAIVVGGLAFLYIIVLNRAFPIAIFLNPEVLLPALLVVGVAPAFGYAVVRYGLMDVTLIIRRSLIYGIITASVAAVYLLVVFGVGNLLGDLIGQQDNRVLSVLAFVVIAFVFDPIKRRAQDWVDRIFYRERSDYQRALLEFSQELPRHIDLRRILDLMIERISAFMHVERVAVTLCHEREGCHAVALGVDPDQCTFDDTPGGLLAHFRDRRTPLSFALPPEELARLPVTVEDRDRLARAGLVLVVPMFLQDSLIGVISVGPKKSGVVYSQEDVDLLSTVGSQAAVAIENARLHQSEIEKQKIVEELTLARRIQMGLLPKTFPTMQGLDVAGVSKPAMSVGGDYYDFIPLDDHRLLVVVADVSGKGIPAALYMSKVQGMIQLAVHMHTSPREMLASVNRRIYDGIERRSFITMVLAVFDTAAREVVLCRAGHTLPLVGTNGEIGTLESAGIGLGLEQGEIFESRLEEIRRPYRPGEVFVFYTDGVTETMDEYWQEFGEARLIEHVRANTRLDAGALQQSILESVAAFSGSTEQHDDRTIVVVRAVA